MDDLKKLTDGELHDRWDRALWATFDTKVTLPMTSGNEAAMEEYRRRQNTLEAVIAERTRRFRKRQREAAGKLRWEQSYRITAGPDSASLHLSGWDAFVGKQLVGSVKCPDKFTKLRWSWAVYQCNSGPIISGELPSLEQAKEVVEKRVSKWFELAGMPLAA